VRREFLPRLKEQAGITGVSVACDPEEFNDLSKNWIVLCGFTRADKPPLFYRFRVDDRTGTISDIN